MSSNTPIIPDIIHVDAIRDALLNRPNTGACVMVGSGFSRNANTVRSGVAPPPLWSDLAQEMFRQLYPEREATERSASDALQIAQAYESNFGRTKLDDFLVRHIRDEEFTPGELHQRLLNLPWRDVFTTNWDTLLEKSNSSIGSPYDLVQNVRELPRMRPPRIVKLHGSLPAQFPLIFTLEDYRTYPEKYALFVNTVRQAMIETVFCLIGFSGSDPNFLSWSGWVRDQLGALAQQIYLVGWLKLPEQDRKALLDLNVVPIDIARHPQSARWPKDLRHQYAVEWFLHALENGIQSYDQVDWPSPVHALSLNVPQHLLPVPGVDSGRPEDHPDPEINVSSPTRSNEPVDSVKAVIDVWAHNRKTYPGWLMYPHGRNHSVLSRRTNDWEPHILGALPELTPVDRLKAVRELLWRRGILLEPMSLEVETAAQNTLAIIDCERRSIEGSEQQQEDWEEIREAWRAVALALLTAARLDCDQERFKLRLESLSAFCEDSPDVSHRVHQERSLWALYSMDLDSLTDLLDNWKVEDCEPVWMLRKAALLTEIRRSSESRPLIEKALALFSDGGEGVDRISHASREGWALGSILSNENSDYIFRKWDELSSLRCHPWDEMVEIDRVLSRSAMEPEGPAYDLGIRRSAVVQWSNESYSRIVAAYRAIRLPEVTGLPPVNLPDSNFPVGTSAASMILKPAAEELIAINPELAIKLALRVFTSESDKGLQRIVSRIHVATLQEDVVTELAQTCVNAIEFSLPRLIVPEEFRANDFSIARIRVAAEVLSRLVMRLPPDLLNTVLDLSLRCYRAVPIHYWLGPSVGNLIRRTWKALPRSHRTDRVLDLLTAPIAGLDGFDADTSCPDPGKFLSEEDFPLSCTVDDKAPFGEAFGFLIKGLRGDAVSRGRANFRLLMMVNSNLLEQNELSAVASELWADADPILGNSSRSEAPLDWAYIVLPELKEGQAEDSFRQKWLTTEHGDLHEDLIYTADMIEQVGAAVLGLRKLERPLPPFTEEEERHIASHVEHLAESFCSGSARFSSRLGSQLRYLGPLVSEITIPSDIAESLSKKAQILLEASSYPDDFYRIHLSEIRTAIGFGLIPGLVKDLPDHADMIDWLRIGLASDEEIVVSSAVAALRTWVSALPYHNLPPIPSDLISGIGAIVASRRGVGLADALSFSVWIYDRGSPEHQSALGSLVLSGLRHLVLSLQYDRQGHDEDMPTLRLLCVELASVMSRNGFADDSTIKRWLDEGRKDPFPEIRRAASESECDKDCP